MEKERKLEEARSEEKTQVEKMEAMNEGNLRLQQEMKELKKKE